MELGVEIRIHVDGHELQGTVQPQCLQVATLEVEKPLLVLVDLVGDLPLQAAHRAGERAAADGDGRRADRRHQQLGRLVDEGLGAQRIGFLERAAGDGQRQAARAALHLQGLQTPVDKLAVPRAGPVAAADDARQPRHGITRRHGEGVRILRVAAGRRDTEADAAQRRAQEERIEVALRRKGHDVAGTLRDGLARRRPAASAAKVLVHRLDDVILRPAARHEEAAREKVGCRRRPLGRLHGERERTGQTGSHYCNPPSR